MSHMLYIKLAYGSPSVTTEYSSQTVDLTKTLRCATVIKAYLLGQSIQPLQRMLNFIPTKHLLSNHLPSIWSHELCVPGVTIRNHAYQKLFSFVVTRPCSLLPLPLSRISTGYVVKLPHSEPFRIIRYDVKLHLPGLGPDTRYGAKLQLWTSRSPRQYQ
jgi:hypothetical protein